MPIESEGEVEGRRLTGLFGWVAKVIFIIIPIIAVLFAFNIHDYFRQAFFKEQYLAIFLALILAGIYLEVPATSKTAKKGLPRYDVVLAVLSFGLCMFFSVTYPQYVLTGMSSGRMLYFVLGALTILLIAEAARRMTGWILVILLAVFIIYARFSSLFPPPFMGRSVPWDQLFVYIVLDSAALFGLPLWVTGSIVFGFILFGGFLMATGGSRLINEFAMVTMGRFRGGPAKVAIVGSSLFGTISGSVVANVSAVGVVTIPMMKSSGYRSDVAAGIEAVASTGGQIMPPVMGITAFLVAEFLAISYATVAIAAAIPAVLYYLVLFVQVDLEAGKTGLKGLSGPMPRIWGTLKTSWLFFIPAVLLIYLLFFLHYEPGKASVVAAASIIVLSVITRETRVGFRRIIKILEDVGRGLLMMGVISAIAGLVVGVIYVTGVGTMLSNFLLSLGGTNLFIVLLITAVLCIVMGMGMPTAAIYVILAVIVAPSLVKLGIPPLAAHLFLFYMGTSSFITPPIALAAFAAASIANANPVAVGLQACRLGIAAFIVPFIFVYSPGLLLIGGIQDILIVVAQSLVGLALLAVGLSGFLFRNIDWGKRLLLIIGSIAILYPVKAGIPGTLWLNIAGAAVSALIILWEWLRRGPSTVTAPVVAGSPSLPEKSLEDK